MLLRRDDQRGESCLTRGPNGELRRAVSPDPIAARNTATDRLTHLAWLVSLVVVLLGALAAGCAPDPPSAAVGITTAGCRNRLGTGSGIFVSVEGYERPFLLTSAHVLKGATEITVHRGDVTASGTVVAFDPEMDVAYLDVDGFETVEPITLDSDDVETGDRGVAYLARDGRIVSLPITIKRRVNIRTENIYIEGETLRPGFELIADIEAGDSGGAVVVGGKVVGVVWARSRRADDRAYAIDPVRAGDLVGEQLRTGVIGSDIDLSRC